MGKKSGNFSGSTVIKSARVHTRGSPRGLKPFPFCPQLDHMTLPMTAAGAQDVAILQSPPNLFFRSVFGMVCRIQQFTTADIPSTPASHILKPLGTTVHMNQGSRERIDNRKEMSQISRGDHSSPVKPRIAMGQQFQRGQSGSLRAPHGNSMALSKRQFQCPQWKRTTRKAVTHANRHPRQSLTPPKLGEQVASTQCSTTPSELRA